MVAIDFEQGFQDAWTRIATFIPKFVGFLVILLIGYVVAKLLSRLVEQLLERVGFDRWVERGSLKSALERSRLDASDILGVVTFWSVFLIALQLAFIAAALAKVVTDLLSAILGAATGGAWIARAAGFAVLLVGIFAALDQLKIAPAIVNGLYYAILAIIVGSAIVAVGGGGIQTMRGYWERTSQSLESKTGEIKTVTVPDAETRPMARVEDEGQDAIPPAPGPRTS